MGEANGTQERDRVDGLLVKLTDSVGVFKAEHHEKDRLAALKAAQEVVRALHSPKDNVYHLVYSVKALSWSHPPKTPGVATTPI